ncbi:hypothetical protein AB0L40_16530 [Patulibacter sp. NPDC049589]|uniref:hypothetical protein n=1 Tax=Patulibacter sp. NPDC049589 TaxID=3154731 RepID=UPI003428683F
MPASTVGSRVASLRPRSRLIIGALALTLVAGAAFLILGRDRVHDFPVGALAEIDERIPAEVRVEVRSPTLARVTFSSRQAPTDGYTPGMTRWPALTAVSLRTTRSDGGCENGGDDFLAGVSRIWSARRGPGVGRVPSPYDVFQFPGRKNRFDKTVDLSAGGSIDLEVARSLPDHVCASVFVQINNGATGPPIFSADKEL